MKIRSALMAFSFLAATLSLAAPPALGFLQLENHVDIPTDCGDDSSFKLLRIKWGSTPINVNFTSSIPSDLLEAVKAGTAPWEAEEHPAGDLAVEVAGEATDGVTVSFAPIDGPLGTLAVTSLTYTIRGKTIVRATITFDSDENWAILPSACGIPVANGISVEDVSVHEFGHALPALDHARGDALTMKQFYSGGMERTLATGDKLGIEKRYGGDGDGNGNGGGPPPCHPRFGC